MRGDNFNVQVKPTTVHEVLREKLESKEFYDLMQLYRFSEIDDQNTTAKRFEAVKKFILGD